MRINSVIILHIFDIQFTIDMKNLHIPTKSSNFASENNSGVVGRLCVGKLSIGRLLTDTPDKNKLLLWNYENPICNRHVLYVE